VVEYLLVSTLVLAVLLALLWYLRRGSYQRSSPTRTGSIRKSFRQSDDTTNTNRNLGRNWLIGLEGEVSGRTYHVGGRQATIGRKVGNFIQVKEKDASRVHCRLEPVDGGLKIVDMKSGNGTFVNDRRVEEYLLQHEDRIRVGSNVFEYASYASFEENAALEAKGFGRSTDEETGIGTPAEIFGTEDSD